jgi:hypothetical protein
MFVEQCAEQVPPRRLDSWRAPTSDAGNAARRLQRQSSASGDARSFHTAVAPASRHYSRRDEGRRKATELDPVRIQHDVLIVPLAVGPFLATVSRIVALPMNTPPGDGRR